MRSLSSTTLCGLISTVAATTPSFFQFSPMFAVIWTSLSPQLALIFRRLVPNMVASTCPLNIGKLITKIWALPYALLTNKDIINKAAILSCQILLEQYQFSGNGFQILQDLLCLHHPGHVNTRAPAYSIIRDSPPTMPSSIALKDQLTELTKYYRGFCNWQTHLSLYPQAKLVKGSEYYLLFIGGMAPLFQN